MYKRMKYYVWIVLVMMFAYVFTVNVYANEPVGSESDLILAYYDVKTGTETLHTVEELNEMLDLGVDSKDFQIISEPQRATKPVIEKQLSVQEQLLNNSVTEFSKSPFDVTPQIIGSNATKAADPETRVQVNNTKINTFPYYCIAKLETDEGEGTGFAVGKKLLATARHCIESDSGQKTTSLKAWFGYNGVAGTYTFRRTYSHVVGFITQPTFNSSVDDWAYVIWSNNTVDNTGAFGMQEAASNNMTVYTAGYPGDLPSNGNEGLRMYECTGSIYQCSTYDFLSTLRAYDGQSGSPVWYYNNGSPYAIGILTHSFFPEYGTNSALARKIESALIGWLQQQGYV